MERLIETKDFYLKTAPWSVNASDITIRMVLDAFEMLKIFLNE